MAKGQIETYNEGNKTIAVQASAKPQLMTAAEFMQFGGELFAGKVILNLKVGEAAGPFTLVDILKDQDLTPTGHRGKKMDPVDVYIGETVEGMKINMPVATAFVQKARDARLSLGDVFAVLRTADYTSRAFKTEGKGYAIAIRSRADAGNKKTLTAAKK